LIVDDNRDAAKSLAMLMQSWKHQVEAVHDGVDAVPAALALQPEVILLDIGLPDIDGYEVLKRLRSEPALSDVYFVAMTGYGQEEDFRRSQEAGFHQHLVKPVKLESLKAILCSPIAAAHAAA
jgi:CheY-like chemotaxis protein